MNQLEVGSTLWPLATTIKLGSSDCSLKGKAVSVLTWSLRKTHPISSVPYAFDALSFPLFLIAFQKPSKLM